MKVPIYEQYLNIVMTMSDIENKNVFVKELVKRHRGGQRLPDSVYQKRKSLLYYKKSLERNSPYYVDLLKIESTDHLKLVLMDIYETIKL